MDLFATLSPPHGSPVRTWVVAWHDGGVDVVLDPAAPPFSGSEGALNIGGALSTFQADVQVTHRDGPDLSLAWANPAAVRLRLPGRLRDQLERVNARRGRLPRVRAGASAAGPIIGYRDLDGAGASLAGTGWSTGTVVKLFVEIPDGLPGIPVQARVESISPSVEGGGWTMVTFVEGTPSSERLADRLVAWLQARLTRLAAA